MKKPDGASDGPVLVLAPEPPYPVAGGGPMRTASLLEYFRRRGPLDLIVFRQPGSPSPAAALPPGMARAVREIDLKPNRRDTASRVWRNVHRMLRGVPPLNDRFAGYEGPISDAVGGRHYSTAVIEHFWCAPYATLLRPHCSRLVLDLHNIESRLLARCGDGRPAAERYVFHRFAAASERLERQWLPLFDHVLVTSESDRDCLLRALPGLPVTVYPNALPPLAPCRRAPGTEETIVFSGNMAYHPNISAVRFFLRHIWPELERRGNIRFRLVGKNPEAIRHLLPANGRVETAGPVEDAVAEIARATVSVAPLLAGSGTRIKILEAWAGGTAVVATSIGAEGLEARDGEHFLIADGAAAFVRAVERVLDSPDLRRRLAAGGRRLYEERYTWPAAWRSLTQSGL